MLSLITNNPFRILGVFANSAMKEIVANKGKIAAFAKVGRSVEFPLDLKNILPPITRTTDMVSQAESKLALPADKLKASLFWFVKAAPTDEVAFNHLFNGDLDTAMSFWARSHGYSSLQNRIIGSLIKGQYPEAARCAEKLYAQHSDRILSEIGCDNLGTSTTDLMHIFVDSLASESIDISKLVYSEMSPEWSTYIKSQTIGPVIDKVNEELNKAKASKGKTPLVRLNAGKNLIRNTRVPLSELKSLLGVSNTQYQMLADKVANEILNCAVDYHSDTSDSDCNTKALELATAANAIAVGQLAKERASDNLKTLKNMQRTEAVSGDLDAVVNTLKSYQNRYSTVSNARSLVSTCKPHVDRVRASLGSSDETFIGLSSAVVNVTLGILVEVINREQSDQTSIIDGSLRSEISDAMGVLSSLSSFTMDSRTRNRYNENKSTLSNMKSQVDQIYNRLHSSYGGSSYGGGYSRPSSSSSGCCVFLAIALIIVIGCLSF